MCEEAREKVDMAKLRGLQYLPKTKIMWEEQYVYQSQDREGNMKPLTGETIEELIVQPVIGKEPQVNKKFVKKFVVLR